MREMKSKARNRSRALFALGAIGLATTVVFAAGSADARKAQKSRCHKGRAVHHSHARHLKRCVRPKPGGGSGSGGSTGGGSGGGSGSGGGTYPPPTTSAENRSLDGSQNNAGHPDWGRAGTQYPRAGAPNYADGVSQMPSGPSPRYVSNRVFNDTGQNLFSENDVSQWGWAWGQFMDHGFGLRDETPAESAPLDFSSSDPLERFTNDFGAIDFARTPAAPGTGVNTPRQQINTISSFIDGSNVYGTTASRLDWLRQGSVDGDPTNNLAQLLLPGGYLPRADARGNAAAAPPVDLMGALMGTPSRAAIAGDVRANENIALTSIHTLFAREHNRIVSALPGSLPQEERFQIARRIVGAEEEFITYNEFLPALGIRLPAYQGYDSHTDPRLTNEFAAVGYRAHSMIHGEFEIDAEPGQYSASQLDAFRAAGINVETAPGGLTLVVPLTLAFGNPDLLQALGEGPVLESLGGEREYKNDEQIDDSLRSVLFQIPKPGAADPASCGTPVISPDCFSGVADLGAIDVQRARDHGIASYNDLRRAYGLAPKTSFRAITGESTESFPSDPQIDPSDPIDDPNILDFTRLLDDEGHPLPLNDNEDAVTGIRRTTLAARLKAVYGSVDKLDPFAGMIAERHLSGAEFGELQYAIWKQQFEDLRDGDRFFYANDSELNRIEHTYGISYRHSLADLVRLNAGVVVQPNVFEAPED